MKPKPKKKKTPKKSVARKPPSDFVSLVAHQLRAPLTSLRWFVKMLMEGEAGKLNRNQKILVSNVYQLVGDMVARINFLLQIGRVESGRLEIKPEFLNLLSLTQDILEILKPQTKQKELKVVIQTKPAILTNLMVDKDIIWNVIQNLLANAIAYSSNKGRIAIYIIYNAKVVKYLVRDYGIGIPAKEQPKIFNKFYRARNAIKFLPVGTGLGLALTKSLVGCWGGKIWFKSKEGKGSTFGFTIPLGGMRAKTGEVTLNV